MVKLNNMTATILNKEEVNTHCNCGSKELLEPYKYCKDCFTKKIDEFQSGGPCSSQKYNGKIDGKLLMHLDRIKYMSFGVHEWLFNKALEGCSESLFKLEYSYNLFNEVKLKAKEQGLL